MAQWVNRLSNSQLTFLRWIGPDEGRGDSHLIYHDAAIRACHDLPSQTMRCFVEPCGWECSPRMRSRC